VWFPWGAVPMGTTLVSRRDDIMATTWPKPRGAGVAWVCLAVPPKKPELSPSGARFPDNREEPLPKLGGCDEFASGMRVRQSSATRQRLFPAFNLAEPAWSALDFS
jgi:hypothetical protein